MTKYWFARRYPPGRGKSNGMAPVSREGWLVVWVFVAAMVIGGLGMLVFGLNGQIVSGIAMFVVMAVAGAGMFIGMAYSRGDTVNTVDDYRQGRVR
jgi:hypothetical protein